MGKMLSNEHLDALGLVDGNCFNFWKYGSVSYMRVPSLPNPTHRQPFRKIIFGRT